MRAQYAMSWAELSLSLGKPKKAKLQWSFDLEQSQVKSGQLACWYTYFLVFTIFLSRKNRHPALQKNQNRFHMLDTFFNKHDKLPNLSSNFFFLFFWRCHNLTSQLPMHYNNFQTPVLFVTLKLWNPTLHSLFTNSIPIHKMVYILSSTLQKSFHIGAA